MPDKGSGYKALELPPANFCLYGNLFGGFDSIGIGETTSNDGNTLWYSGEDKYHENGVGFFSPQRHTRSVMECIYSRIITMRLAGQPLNISLVQVYALTSIASKDEMVWSSSINSYRSRWKLFRKRMFFWPLVIGMRKWELMHIQSEKALLESFDWEQQMKED